MASASFQKPIEDIVECSICMETLKNTRVLPCIHTFCLRCIKKHGIGKKPGDTAQCPYCRKEYPVPIGGFDKLPKNTFIEKLLEVQCTLTTEWSNSSTICTLPGHGKKSKSQSLAIWYCVECKLQMCGGCRSVHLRPGGTSFHHVLPVQKESPCQEHPYKQLDRFCKFCKTPVCEECCTSNHKGHEWSTLVDYVRAQQAETEKFKFINIMPNRQPNRLERKLPLPSDAICNAVQIPDLIVPRQDANVYGFTSFMDKMQNEVRKISAEMDRLKPLPVLYEEPIKYCQLIPVVENDRRKSPFNLVKKQKKAPRYIIEDDRFRWQKGEEHSCNPTLAIVVILLLAFCWQSRAWMNEERARWSSEKYNYTKSEEILKKQIQKLTVQLDKERASYLSEKRKYTVAEDKWKRQVNDLIVKQERDLLECVPSRSKRSVDDTVLTEVVQPGPAEKTCSLIRQGSDVL